MPRWLRDLVAGPAAPAAEGTDDSTVTATRVRGFDVVVTNTRPDVRTADVLARLDRALGLVETHTPHYFRHLRRSFTRLVVQRYPCRGAYDPATGECLVELTFCVNPAFNDAQVAATVLHEGMHARLHRLGFPLDMADRERQERFCRRAEVEFGRLAPGGAPVVARASGILEGEGVDVAPVIDARLAAARVAAADRAAARAADRA